MRAPASRGWGTTTPARSEPARARASPPRPASARPPTKTAYRSTVARASTSSHVPRLTARYSQARRTVRIAIDIDSTLHPHGPLVAPAPRRRFGVALPYEEQVPETARRLADDELRACIEDTHTDAAIAGARPYPHAVEIVNGWYEAGHDIEISSHRAERSVAATRRWLHAIGLRHHSLYCGGD